ncbi:YraN family protein [Clostridium sp. D53t1_180928_C8]|uniref:YraN family protein n=1 Tax=Clostridium sp. D53t1_180928_C8 TaxID=2787101 RepID=UPI0018AAE1E6|nr:YraN family protein [Clostridium sp. D53t1_180928_C8]
MKKYNKAIGAYGETIASDFLTTNGYKILDMNYRNRYGEIDIICENDNIIIFCEIKSRYTNTFGSPIESVTYNKQKQIIKLSQVYLLYKKYQNYNVRYDVIEIIFNNKNASFKLNHLKDAFRTY